MAAEAGAATTNAAVSATTPNVGLILPRATAAAPVRSSSSDLKKVSGVPEFVKNPTGRAGIASEKPDCLKFAANF
ncbi:hypothetical protein GCG21_07835 [Pseudactinotalea sp. HY160]|uniref:hypothetical protein n=1 Tax=Pseudactinotalea sp. HY160 TaxID=2654490 RepID=UPI00128C31EF|nr:hypothetical protein [Pseudactinotalea sp. HY160]MPV49915.1 hypothetical protein [Pseudactinotalea sp. HY160]